jgi:hypothetical protein
MRRENLTMEDAMHTAPVLDLEEAEEIIPAENLAMEELEAPPEAPEEEEI